MIKNSTSDEHGLQCLMSEIGSGLESPGDLP